MELLLHPKTEESVKMFLSSPSHAVAITGMAGAGKDYAGWYLAAQLLDISIQAAQKHSQVFLIDSESEDGIEKVRELQSFISLKVPGNQTIKRVVMIRMLEKLRHEAQNALLKTIEEPPLDTVIICTMTSAKDALPTILSRLQTISVLPITRRQAADNFAQFPKSELESAYSISEGNVSLFKALLEENTDHPFRKAIIDAKTILQAANYERLSKVDFIVKDKEQNISSLLEALYKLLHAATFAATKKSDVRRDDIKRLNRQVASVLRAQELFDKKTQPKLILTWLFFEL